jgi:RNA polymerase sigma factor (sigma-70 family)
MKPHLRRPQDSNENLTIGGARTLMRTSRSAGPGRLPQVTPKPPFEVVVAEHGATVLRVCRAVLGPADANAEAWLVTIAHRKAIDVTRATARRAVPVADVPEPLMTQRAGGRDIDLADALAALPRRQREAIAYHYLAGLPYQDVAAITGGSTDAARRAAADGIARLRKTYPGAALPDGENP